MKKSPPSPPVRVSLGTIATEVGVSRATVSLALRNEPRISTAMRRKVQKVARRLGYQPNPEIARLRREARYARMRLEPEIISVINAWPRAREMDLTPYIRKLVEGARERAATLGYRLEEFRLKESGFTGRRLSEILVARGIRGVLLPPLPSAMKHLSLDWTKFTVVSMTHTLTRPVVHCALPSQFENLSLALRKLRHLRHLRYQRIGVVLLDHGYSSHFLRHFKSAFLLDQAAVPPRHRVPVLISHRHSPEVFLKWYRKHRPEALILPSAQDYDFLCELGLGPPQDVGFAALTGPHPKKDVAYVDEQPAQVGSAAVDLLSRLLEYDEPGLPASPRTVLVTGSWVDGATLRQRA